MFKSGELQISTAEVHHRFVNRLLDVFTKNNASCPQGVDRWFACSPLLLFALHHIIEKVPRSYTVILSAICLMPQLGIARQAQMPSEETKKPPLLKAWSCWGRLLTSWWRVRLAHPCARPFGATLARCPKLLRAILSNPLRGFSSPATDTNKKATRRVAFLFVYGGGGVTLEQTALYQRFIRLVNRWLLWINKLKACLFIQLFECCWGHCLMI